VDMCASVQVYVGVGVCVWGGGVMEQRQRQNVGAAAAVGRVAVDLCAVVQVGLGGKTGVGSQGRRA
jgi:hypothetical protein